MIFPTPIYRFFSKKEYAEKLVQKGEMRFTPVSAFTSLNDIRFRYVNESYYNLKTRNNYTDKITYDGKEYNLEGGENTSNYIRIGDAWAFCGTTSIISSAKKSFPTYIKNLDIKFDNPDELFGSITIPSKT